MFFVIRGPGASGFVVFLAHSVVHTHAKILPLSTVHSLRYGWGDQPITKALRNSLIFFAKHSKRDTAQYLASIISYETQEIKTR